jgi:predicted permease
MLAKNPGFAAVAVLTLGIGVGANITIFGFANALLLKPLDADQPDRLIRAYGAPSDAIAFVDYDDYREYRDRTQSLSNLAIFHWGGLQPVRVDGPPAMVHVMPVSGNYFATLGVRAALGRVIDDGDDYKGAVGVILLSDDCWRHRFAADPTVVGRTIFVNRRPYTIIGITATSFEGTIGGPVIPQLYVAWNGPLGAPRGGHLIGRLKPGASRGTAQADLSRIAAQLSAERKQRVETYVYPATVLAPSFLRTMTLFAALFMGVVGLVLLIACDNIAILLLVRSAARTREVGIRLALGATRGKLIRQFLAESSLLSALGGLCAAGFAAVTARLVTQIYLPVPMPIALRFDFDWRVVAFALGISIATTLMFGLGPALQSIRTGVASSPRAGGSTVDAGGSRTRTGLIVAQVAMSTTLLITAGVLVRSLGSAGRADRGLVADHVLMATFHLPSEEYTRQQGVAFYETLLERLESSPGIESLNLVDNIPLANNAPLASADMSAAPGQTDASGGRQRVYINGVSRGHFQTLRIRLLKGRDFTARDDASSPAVGIVNETLAHRFWPGQSPIGKPLWGPDGTRIELIGLAADSKYEALEESPKPFLYRPLSQQYAPTATVLVKTSGNPLTATSLVRTKIAELDPNLLAYNLIPLEDRMGLSLLPNRAAAIVAAILGLLALALGAVGTYGTMAFVVEQRRREIGVRMALGASPWGIVRLITYQGMTWTALGLAIGAAGAFIVVRLLRGLMYGISAADPVAFVGIVLLLAGTAYAACYLPARHGSKMDPLAALRYE